MDISSTEKELIQAIEYMAEQIDTLQKLVQNLRTRINTLESPKESPGAPVVKMDAGIKSPLGKSIGG